MKSFSIAAAAAFLLALSSAAIAGLPPTTLPPVNVTGDPCSYGFTCIYPSGFSNFLAPIINFPPDVARIGPEDFSLISTCNSMNGRAKQILTDRAKQIHCNVDNPPPAPHFPSPTQGQWASNGCGTGTWLSDTIYPRIAGLGIPGYTGNLTHPLPHVSFEDACAYHDSCYYTGSYKSLCDIGFLNQMTDACSSAGSYASSCRALRNEYYEAVNLGGGDAYDDDHRVMECAKISNALKNDDCVA